MIKEERRRTKVLLHATDGPPGRDRRLDRQQVVALVRQLDLLCITKASAEQALSASGQACRAKVALKLRKRKSGLTRSF